MAVTAPADKRFRRAHLKPAHKRPGWAAWQWRALAAVVVVGVAAYTAHRGIEALRGLPIFRVQQILVHGNHRLSIGEVTALLDGLRGESIFFANLEERRRGVLNSPWVAEAFLRRTLPSTIDVTVLERAPLGIGRINGALYLVDDRGAVIDEYGPSYSDLDLPIIDGLSAVAGVPAMPGLASQDVPRAMLAHRLLDALRLQNMSNRISQIDVSDARNAVVLLDGDTVSIRLGNEHFVERLQSYFDLAPALRAQVPDIDYVDLRFGERVYVRPAHDGTATAPKGVSSSAPRPAKRKGA